MGFSVSASTVVVFVGALLALGTVYPAAANGYEHVTEASHDVSDRRLDRQNTAIAVTQATYNASNETLTVAVENTGSTALSVNRTDVLVDNAYRSSFDSRAVDGDATTTLWLPGETLRVELSSPDRPDRVTVATEHGVTAGTGVS